MINVILGLLILLVFFLLLNGFMNANPSSLSRNTTKIFALIALPIAFWLTIRGQFWVSLPLGIWAFSHLLGKKIAISIPGFDQVGGKKTGQTSSVLTEFFEMRLDHDSGEMDGQILKGHFAGQLLANLDMSDLIQVHAECALDNQSLQLLEAYLERNHPNWRDHAFMDGLGGNTNQNGPLSIQEAYEILGLNPGASKEEIRKAHRNLMKRFHPDQGGSNYLATKINEAKDILLEEVS